MGNLRPKVLQVLPSFDIGGAERMVLTLLDELNGEAFEHEVCVIGEGPLVEALQERRIPVRQVKPYHGTKDLSFMRRLTSITKNIRPSVVHCHMWPASLYAVLCGRALGIPVISTFHSNYKLDSIYEKCCLRLIQLLCGRMVMVSRSQLKHFGVSADSSRAQVIHNGVCIPESAEDRALCQRAATKADLKLSPQHQVITYVANLRPVKAHAILLEAFSLLSKENPNLRLLLAGDGPLLGPLKDQCEVLGISSKVLFLGARDDVLDLLAVTDVFVSSSSSEALCMAIIEAMTMSRPVVASDVGGNGELIDNQVNGLLVPYGNTKALADAVASILRDPAAAVRMGAEGRAKARKCFSAQRMAEEYGQLYLAAQQLCSAASANTQLTTA